MSIIKKDDKNLKIKKVALSCLNQLAVRDDALDTLKGITNDLIQIFNKYCKEFEIFSDIVLLMSNMED